MPDRIIIWDGLPDPLNRIIRFPVPLSGGGGSSNTILNGIVDPTIEGIDGDFYINTVTDYIFGPKTGGVWGAGTSLIGPSVEYERRHDWVTPNDYCGKAPLGSLETVAVWTITRIVVSVIGTTTKSTLTSVKWSDRLILPW